MRFLGLDPADPTRSFWLPAFVRSQSSASRKLAPAFGSTQYLPLVARLRDRQPPSKPSVVGPWARTHANRQNPQTRYSLGHLDVCARLSRMARAWLRMLLRRRRWHVQIHQGIRCTVRRTVAYRNIPERARDRPSGLASSSNLINGTDETKPPVLPPPVRFDSRVVEPEQEWEKIGQVRTSFLSPRAGKPLTPVLW